MCDGLFLNFHYFMEASFVEVFKIAYERNGVSHGGLVLKPEFGFAGVLVPKFADPSCESLE